MLKYVNNSLYGFTLWRCMMIKTVVRTLGTTTFWDPRAFGSLFVLERVASPRRCPKTGSRDLTTRNMICSPLAGHPFHTGRWGCQFSAHHSSFGQESTNLPSTCSTKLPRPSEMVYPPHPASEIGACLPSFLDQWESIDASPLSWVWSRGFI